MSNQGTIQQVKQLKLSDKIFCGPSQQDLCSDFIECSPIDDQLAKEQIRSVAIEEGQDLDNLLVVSRLRSASDADAKALQQQLYNDLVSSPVPKAPRLRPQQRKQISDYQTSAGLQQSQKLPNSVLFQSQLACSNDQKELDGAVFQNEIDFTGSGWEISTNFSKKENCIIIEQQNSDLTLIDKNFEDLQHEQERSEFSEQREAEDLSSSSSCSSFVDANQLDLAYNLFSPQFGEDFDQFELDWSPKRLYEADCDELSEDDDFKAIFQPK